MVRFPFCLLWLRVSVREVALTKAFRAALSLNTWQHLTSSGDYSCVSPPGPFKKGHPSLSQTVPDVLAIEIIGYLVFPGRGFCAGTPTN
jgi:hypothetical protein